MNFDGANCGKCGTACAKGEHCIVGKCQKCPPGAQEICGNGRDDDCDGQADEPSDCTALPVHNNTHDYSVSSKGNIFVVYPNGKSIFGICYDKDGKVIKPNFEIFKSNYYAGFPSVYTSSKTGHTLVVWISGPNSSYRYNRPHYRLFDANCENPTPTILFPFSSTPRTNHYDYSASIDANGNFAVLYRDNKYNPTIAFYDNKGKIRGSSQKLVGKGETYCRSQGWGLHVAMNSKGDGIVSCQHSSSYIAYRRFYADTSFHKEDYQRVDKSVGNLHSSSMVHSVGINENGAFAFQWHARNQQKLSTAFYDASGKFKIAPEIGTNIYNNNQAFRYVHQQIQVIGNDFVFRDANSNNNEIMRWYRYSPTGAIRSAGGGRYHQFLMRVGGGKPHVYTQGKIYPLALKLAPSTGLCSGKACICTPGYSEPCFSHNYNRKPCVRGNRVCDKSGLKWSACIGEVLPQIEKCGNGIDDDCNGNIDESCPLGTNTSAHVNSRHDLAVTNDGSSAMVSWTGRGLFLQCFNSSLVQVGKTALVNTYPTGAWDPFVRASKKSKLFIVGWRATNIYSYSGGGEWSYRVYDDQCKPKTTVIKTGIQYLESTSIIDMHIAHTGEVGIIWRNNKNQPVLSLFKTDGTPLNPKVFTPATTCNHSVKITFSPKSNMGVWTCQGSHNQPIYYMRFRANGTPIDTKPMEVAGSKNNSSYNHSHLLGVNEDDDFMIYWLHHQHRYMLFTIYNSAGKPQDSKMPFSPNYYGTNSSNNIFRYLRSRIMYMGSDFVVNNMAQHGNARMLYRYNKKGSLVASAPATRASDYFYRTSSTSVYGHYNARIEKNVVDLSPKKGICNGIPCECVPGTKQNCETHPRRADCNGGSQFCNAKGSWGPCIGENLPEPEKCGNTVDEDCDGKLNEGCPFTKGAISVPGIHDMDVSDTGKIIAVYANGRALVAYCYDSTGKVTKNHLVLTKFHEYPYHPMVKYSKNGKYILIAWGNSRVSSSSYLEIHGQLLDGNCKPLGSRMPLSNGVVDTHGYEYDVAVTNNGMVSAIYKSQNGTTTYFTMYNNKGTKVAGPTKIDPTDKLCRSRGYGIHVAMNPVGGEGIVSCQASDSTPVYFRRFDPTGKLLGAGMTPVKYSELRKSSYTYTHAIGVNSQGAFTIFWANRQAKQFNANFYDKSGNILNKQQAIVVETPRYTPLYTYRATHQHVELIGDNFVFRTGYDLSFSNVYTVNWYIYSPAGKPLKKGSLTDNNLDRFRMRFSSSKNYIPDRRYHLIRINAINFKSAGNIR